jgi:phosphoribosyl 1,2-cyclic phosphate phosphodiesterase
MKIIFTGTGTSQGVPVIGCTCEVCQSADPRDNRLRTSAVIETDNQRFVIDTGPDFRQQMLREKITTLNAILLTHAHKDHLGGLDDVRAFNYFMREAAQVYASTEVQRCIKKEFSYAFKKNPYPGVPVIDLHTINNIPFSIGGQEIIPIRSYHFGTRNTVYGFRFGDLTYITDAIRIPEREKRKILGTRILVLNALRKKKHYSHFNLEEALMIMDEVRPEKGFLTHISHQMGLHAEVEGELPSHIRLAYDGLSVVF